MNLELVALLHTLARLPLQFGLNFSTHSLLIEPRRRWQRTIAPFFRGPTIHLTLSSSDSGWVTQHLLRATAAGALLEGKKSRTSAQNVASFSRVSLFSLLAAKPLEAITHNPCLIEPSWTLEPCSSDSLVAEPTEPRGTYATGEQKKNTQLLETGQLNWPPREGRKKRTNDRTRKGSFGTGCYPERDTTAKGR